MTNHSKDEISALLKELNDLRTKNLELERLVIHDDLTELFNRRKLNELLTTEVRRAKRYERSLSIILFDIDNFKQINDRYGHLAGDTMLTEIAKCLTTTLRKTDYFGRWGGDEFLIICPETTIAGAKQLAERLKEAFKSLSFKEEKKISASFGVAEFQAKQNEKSFFTQADEALYREKNKKV